MDAAAVAVENSFLEQKLSEPIKKRKTIVQPDEDTLRTIFELGKLMCTQREIAAVLGIAERTFRDFMTYYPEARDALEDGMEHAKISLRRKQFAQADKSAPVAIFLGKNYLGQKDEHHTTTTVNKPASEMTEEQLLEIAERGSSQKPRSVKTLQ